MSAKLSPGTPSEGQTCSLRSHSHLNQYIGTYFYVWFNDINNTRTKLTNLKISHYIVTHVSYMQRFIYLLLLSLYLWLSVSLSVCFLSLSLYIWIYSNLTALYLNVYFNTILNAYISKIYLSQFHHQLMNLLMFQNVKAAMRNQYWYEYSYIK